MATLNLQEAHDLVVRALTKSGANDAMAQATARGLVRADAQGLGICGRANELHALNARADHVFDSVAAATGEIASHMARSDHFEPLTLLPAMAEIASEMVHDVMTAFAARDAALAGHRPWQQLAGAARALANATCQHHGPAP